MIERPILLDRNENQYGTTPACLDVLRQWMQKSGIAIKFFDEERLSSYVRITVGTEAQNDILLSAVKEFADLPTPVETVLPR